MNQFLELIFILFVLAIISAFINNLVVNEKLLLYVKSALSVVIILTVITFISNMKINNNFDIAFDDFSIDTETVWEQQALRCEQLIEKEMIEDCRKNNISVTEIDAKVICKDNNFEIESIKIYGIDKYSAKNYISGKYRIGLAYINTDGD